MNADEPSAVPTPIPDADPDGEVAAPKVGNQPPLGPGPGADDATLKLFKAFVRDGRIEVLPAKQGRRLVLLERVAQLFEPGIRYDETQVNRILRGVHDDYVALRRYLVEAQLLGRENGEYWRIGGTVDL